MSLQEEKPMSSRHSSPSQGSTPPTGGEGPLASPGTSAGGASDTSQNPSHQDSSLSVDPVQLLFDYQNPDWAAFFLADGFPRFLQIENTDKSLKMSQVNPGAVTRSINALLGPKDRANYTVKPFHSSGILMIEVETREVAVKFLSINKLADVTVKVSVHNSLNQSKRETYSHTLDRMSPIEICQELEKEHVVDVYPKKYKDGKRTGRYVFTFCKDTPLHFKMMMGYERLTFEPHVPNPRLCYNCLDFGHVRDCKKEMKCAKCGEAGHDYNACQNHPECVNCGQPHPATSKNCPAYKFEQKVLHLKTTQRLSFPAARDSALKTYPALARQTNKYRAKVDSVRNDMAAIVANSGPSQQAPPKPAAVDHTSQQVLVDMMAAQQKQISELKDTIIALTTTISTLTKVPIITPTIPSKPTHTSKSSKSTSLVSDSDSEEMDTTQKKEPIKRKRGSGSSPAPASAKKQASSSRAKQQGSHGLSSSEEEATASKSPGSGRRSPVRSLKDAESQGDSEAGDGATAATSLTKRSKETLRSKPSIDRDRWKQFDNNKGLYQPSGEDTS